MPSLYSEDSVLDLPDPTPIPTPEDHDPMDDGEVLPVRAAKLAPLPQAPQGPLRPDPQDTQHLSLGDQEWTARLVSLLTHLDYYRCSLEQHRLSEDTSLIVEKAELMVQITEEVARKVTFVKAHSDKLTGAIAKAGAFFTAASSLRRQPGKGLLNNVLHAFSGPDHAFSPELIRDYLFSGADTLNSYFSLFTDRYSSTLASRRWVDAASAFLGEFKQTIRQLPEA